MSEIPEDVMAKAREALPQYWRDDAFQVECVARAIMAERERCADVAFRMEVAGFSEIHRAIRGDTE